jgi:hypothetical protein
VRKPFGNGFYATYKNLKELENSSDLIIVAEPKRNKYPEGERFTFTDVEVEKIIKNDKERKVKKNAVITVEEPYFINDETFFPGKTLTFENMLENNIIITI